MHFSFRIIVVLFFSFICVKSSLNAQSQPERAQLGFDTLSGPLPSLIKAQKRPYLVISNIEVPPQKTVTIEPGTVFLFKNFAGLHVRGRLIARASEGAPILFTSEYDQTSNPRSSRDANPFDWDGIYMTSDALGSQMSYCKIMFSVYGLLSDTKLIRLNPVIFKDNGKSWITIENEEFPISNNETFNYVLEKNDPLLKNVAIDLVKDPLYTKRTAMRTSSILAALSGFSMTGIYCYSWVKSEHSLKNLSDENSFENLNQDNGSTLWKNAELKRKKDSFLIVGGLLVSVIGVTGIRWSYTF